MWLGRWNLLRWTSGEVLRHRFFPPAMDYPQPSRKLWHGRFFQNIFESPNKKLLRKLWCNFCCSTLVLPSTDYSSINQNGFARSFSPPPKKPGEGNSMPPLGKIRARSFVQLLLRAKQDTFKSNFENNLHAASQFYLPLDSFHGQKIIARAFSTHNFLQHFLKRYFD